MTDQARYADLVERLRGEGAGSSGGDAVDAADAIEALEAEVTALRDLRYGRPSKDTAK